MRTSAGTAPGADATRYSRSVRLTSHKVATAPGAVPALLARAAKRLSSYNPFFKDHQTTVIFNCRNLATGLRLTSLEGKKDEAASSTVAVYTQTTDVEGEVNGLITYDRKFIKVDPALLRERSHPHDQMRSSPISPSV